MSILTRPILEINLDNLTENYLTLQKISGKATAAAVVKDDAYGLDAAKVAGILYRRAKCRHFFVAHAVEGRAVREAAPDAQIYVLQNFEAESIEDIYAKVGEGLVTGWDVLKAVYPAYKQSKLEKVVKSIKVPSFKKVIKKDKKSEPLKIKGLIPGMAVHFAGCCHPLPGDRIVGIVTTGKGVAVHTIDCKALEKYADEPERWLDIAWGEEAVNEMHTGRLKVMLANEPGSLAELSNLVARNNGNISNLNIVYRTVSYFELLLDIDVKDLKHLTDIIAALKASKVVSYVSRANQ